MLHNRLLYPVGQGGFAFEHIDGLSIIYDCGSDTSPKRVEMYIDQLLNKGFQTVDYIFISHFDRDHVNCLMYLVNHLHVKNAVVPNIHRNRRIMYNALTYGAYNRIMDLFQSPDCKIIEVEEGATHRIDVPNCPLWEWIARSMFEANDWNVLDTVLVSEGIDTNRLQEPGFVSLNRKQIARCFKLAFGVSSTNAKGLIMLSHKTQNAMVSTMQMTRSNSPLQIINSQTGALYVGDAVLLGRHQQTAHSFLMQYEPKGLLLMQVPHHGSHNNSDHTLVQYFPAQYYFVCNKDDVRINNNTLYGSIQQIALMIHDIDAEMVCGDIEVL